MSNIIGTYENKILKAKLSIATANDSTGAITGMVTVGSTEIPFSGVWNASTVAPNGIMAFTGSIPQIMMGGAAQTDDINRFSSVSVGFSVAQKDNNTMIVTGKLMRV